MESHWELWSGKQGWRYSFSAYFPVILRKVNQVWYEAYCTYLLTEDSKWFSPDSNTYSQWHVTPCVHTKDYNLAHTGAVVPQWPLWQHSSTRRTGVTYNRKIQSVLGTEEGKCGSVCNTRPEASHGRSFQCSEWFGTHRDVDLWHIWWARRRGSVFYH